ncbi:hypothetical protein ATERTT37_001518 [Aspergillus terreus]
MGPEATAYLHGHVYTVDERKPWVEAFIVSASGRFEAIGANDEILNLAKSRNLTTYDLENAFVMPGIHDAHTHLLLASMQKLNEIDIGSDSTAATIAEKIKKGQSACVCAHAHVRGDWLIANFYAGQNFPDGKIDRKYLDDAFPDRPLLVRDVSCHNVAMNSAGLKHAGYNLTEETDPDGGKYMRRPDGSLTGELVEAAAAQALTRLPQPPVSYVKEAILYGIRTSQRFGITSVQEASANTIYLRALRELEQEGRLDMDVFPHIVDTPTMFAAESPESLQNLINDIFRMAKLRITAEMSPAIFHETELTSNFPHIFRWPFKELKDAGVHVTVGSDWFLPPTPDLFPALSAIVERFGPETGKTAKEVGGEKVCRMITLAGAEAVGKEKEMGNIEVGKKANFIVVDRDLSRGEFANAKVLKTWFEGKIVWEDGKTTV